MKKNKSTKRALIGSAMSLILCITMLLGTTFAWFTDTASTSVHKIEAGTLKVELVDENDEPLTEALNWVKADKGKNEDILWEPGASYHLPGFKIKNSGNLALKYKLQIAGIKEGNAELLKALDFTFTEGDNTLNLSEEGHLGADTTSELITISAKMKKTAGNEYQGMTVDGIAITVVAAQDTVEYDSNNNTYDQDATYPMAAISGVIKDGNTVLQENDSEYNVKLTAPANSVGEDVDTLTLTVENTATPSNISVSDTQTSSTFEVSLKDQNGDPVSAAGNTLFEVEMNIGKDRTGLSIYHNGNKMTDDGTTLTENADHYVYDSASGIVTMKVSSFSPFTAVFNKDSWSNRTETEFDTPISEKDKVVTISNAKDLALFARQITDEGKSYSGYTVKFTNDIDLGECIWKPINGRGKMDNIVFEGNGYKIKNMIVRGCTNSSGYGAGFIGDTSGSITFKNITFDHADVLFKDGVEGKYWGNIGGIIMGYTYGTTLFENVTVTNSEIEGYGKIGILLGMGANPGVAVTFRNCISRNNIIHATYNMGGLAGLIIREKGVDNTKIEGCTVENITVDKEPVNKYLELTQEQAIFTSDDTPEGEKSNREISGLYVQLKLGAEGYYYGGYADYYVSYGNSSYDPQVVGKTDMKISNSEYLVNK